MIPIQVIKELERREESISFGSVSLTVVKHDNHKTRYLWAEETSWVEASPTSGGGLPQKQEEITENEGNSAVLPAGVRK
jgi:hypothetical protein